MNRSITEVTETRAPLGGYLISPAHPVPRDHRSQLRAWSRDRHRAVLAVGTVAVVAVVAIAERLWPFERSWNRDHGDTRTDAAHLIVSNLVLPELYKRMFILSRSSPSARWWRHISGSASGRATGRSSRSWRYLRSSPSSFSTGRIAGRTSVRRSGASTPCITARDRGSVHCFIQQGSIGDEDWLPGLLEHYLASCSQVSLRSGRVWPSRRSRTPPVSERWLRLLGSVLARELRIGESGVPAPRWK